MNTNYRAKKIHIIGSVGSGKTTLARDLSALLDAAHYELDNVVWERNAEGDRRRADTEKREILKEITRAAAWIIEGVHTDDWVEDSLHHADVIILLEPGYKVRQLRIIKRYLRQKAGLESANYKPTLRIFLNMFKWNRYFERTAKPCILDRFVNDGHKVIVAENKADVIEYLRCD
ncbi:DNA topology modulation protein FlaR [Terribacillus sp. 7520-G]|uniref:DNA topology modulation protein FlaR n=1 Tax=Terribacillus TaxID=459532 RepID=UPI000BA756B6|nr:DNA topology modulation protein FlaR [Terribacillus sp. 7520-G]PAD37607.1 DNA topology modulation protein FlaR [Terribacillus sp. 7520-G]